MAKGRIEIDEHLCKGCELCTAVCPQGVLHMATDRFTAKGYYPVELIDPDAQCTGCGLCAVMCPDVAITVFRMEKIKKVLA